MQTFFFTIFYKYYLFDTGPDKITRLQNQRPDNIKIQQSLYLEISLSRDKKMI